jgi:glycine hydroxymethyltransferase
MQPAFKTYQQQVVVNAQTMAAVFIERGYDVVLTAQTTICS